MEFISGEYIRTSIEETKERLFRHSLIPWTIECTKCTSIFEIGNGWIEPNNGRMLTTLLGIYEIRQIPEVRKIFNFPHKWKKIIYEKRVNNNFKFLIELTITIANISYSFILENLLGISKEKGKLQMDFYGIEKELDSTFIETLRLAAKNSLDKLYADSIKATSSYGFKISTFSRSVLQKYPLSQLSYPKEEPFTRILFDQLTTVFQLIYLSDSEDQLVESLRNVAVVAKKILRK